MSFVKFLGTAGARFVMIDQLRSSGGVWINSGGTNLILDPGPGSLVRCHSARPKLDPKKLDAVVLTHKHLDHSGDLNVMVEAMTRGGFEHRGKVFLPHDAFGAQGVLFSYLRGFPEEIIFLNTDERYKVGDIEFSPAVKNTHSVETYGIKFFLGGETISFVSDTRYFNRLAEVYQGSDVLVLNVVFYERRSEIDHMSIDDAIELIRAVNPKRAILTHFGMTMLKQKPYMIEKELQRGLDRDVVLAYDGYTLDLPLVA